MPIPKWVRSLGLVFLAACGGGGGGGGGGGTGGTPGVPGIPGPYYAPLPAVTRVHAMTPANDASGDVYLGGEFSQYDSIVSGSIVRLNSDRTVDGAFNVGTGFDTGGAHKVYAIAMAADGSGDLYVGGWFSSYNGTASNRIIRLNSDGTVDAGFSVGTGFAGAGSTAIVYNVCIAGDGTGDIYVAGDFASYNGTAAVNLIRLNPDGSVDGTFNVGAGFDDIVKSICAADDGSGKVYVGGDFTLYKGGAANHIVRLGTTGAIDAAFTTGVGTNNNVETIVGTSDASGDIYVGGSFSAYNNTFIGRLARIDKNGALNAGFAVGITGFNAPVVAIAHAGDGTGDIYVGGGFSSYQGGAVANLLRLNSNASIDAAFATGTGLGGGSSTDAVAAGDGTGDLLVSGDFTSYNGVPVNWIARINPDGTLDP